MKCFPSHSLCRVGVFMFLLGAGVVAGELPQSVLGKLASNQFEVRKKAYDDLKEWSVKNMETSSEVLYKVWRASKDPEVKARCYALMRDMLTQRNSNRGKGFVGIRMEKALLPDQAGGEPLPVVRIISVLPGTPAEKTGLKAGDLVTGIDALAFDKKPQNNEKLGAVFHFRAYIQSKHPNTIITLHIMRKGKAIDKKITLMRRPVSVNTNGNKKEKELFFKKWLQKMGGS